MKHGFKRRKYIPEEQELLIPEDEWLQASCVGYSFVNVHRQDRLVLQFVIRSLGPFHGHSVYLWFQGIETKKGGRWAVSTLKGKYARCFYRANPEQPRVKRRDRLPISAWANKVYDIRMRTVRMDSKQRPLPEQSMYSTVEDVLPEGMGRGPKP